MTQLLYLDDSYVCEFDAIVAKADGNKIVPDKTYFYPGGGGQPADNGAILKNGDEFRISGMKKEGDDILIILDKEGLAAGDSVHCKLDWEHRYKLMRCHTAAHIISAIINRESGALITGNQLGADKTRIDFSMNEFSNEIAQEFVRKANEAIARGIDVAIKNMRREDAEKIPMISKLAKGLPSGLKELRIVEIGDVDTQADGGCHVRNTREIGQMALLKTENKGKNNRRIYFDVDVA